MINFKDLDNSVNSLAKGAFLVSGDEKPNVMTIAWGGVGIMWFKPVFIVPVRQSRYTKEHIDKTGCFTVSVPFGSKMKDAVSFCGSKSGRDVDKFSETGLKPVKAKEVNSYVIEGCDKYYECRVLYKMPIDRDSLLHDEAMHYLTNDMHTLYIGEIVSTY